MDITKIAYEKYRLDWMLRNGWSLTELVKYLTEMQNDFPGISVEEMFNEWESDYGFYGSLWVCYDEFMGAEFLDINYMLSLLNNDQQKIYLKYIMENMENEK